MSLKTVPSSTAVLFPFAPSPFRNARQDCTQPVSLYVGASQKSSLRGVLSRSSGGTAAVAGASIGGLDATCGEQAASCMEEAVLGPVGGPRMARQEQQRSLQ